MVTSISSIDALPGGPFNGTGTVGIVITSGIPTFFKIVGAELNGIISVRWYPKNPGSLLFEVRNIILVDNTYGSFMIMVKDNYLNSNDRAGRVSFRLNDGTVIDYPTKTWGPVSAGPLWTSPEQGLITG